MELEIKEILKVLPHRYPFLFVDGVEKIEPGTQIVAYKNITYNEPYLQGHFSEAPIFPGVLIIESMVQAGGILAHYSNPQLFSKGENKNYLLLSVDKVKFRQPAYPGDKLIIKCNIVAVKDNIIKLRGEVTTQNKKVAEGEFIISVVTKDEFNSL